MIKITCTEKEKEMLVGGMILICPFAKDVEISCECDIENLPKKACSKCVEENIDWDIIPEAVDWSKVEVDTPILVSENNIDWTKRHFAKYENNKVYVWVKGQTSWTAYDDMNIDLPYAKLADKE